MPPIHRIAVHLGRLDPRRMLHLELRTRLRPSDIS